MTVAQPTANPSADLYAGPNDRADVPAYYPQGADMDAVQRAALERADETLVLNFGPHHPSTHGVLRLVVELSGETVTSLRPGMGFLHTGIEKNMEFKTWTQAVTYVTRADYCAPLFNEAAYVASVERLLNIEDQIPQRAKDIRILMLELNRMSSHFVAIGTGALELGAFTPATIGFRERDVILSFFEATTGLRMNHAYFRPGGVAVDLPDDGIARLREIIGWMKSHLPEYAQLANENPIFGARLKGVAVADLATCMALGMSGPPLRATGLPHDLRKSEPIWGYETYDFDVCTWDSCDAYGRFRIRLNEMWESLRIVEQATDRLERSEGEPVMVADPKIAWPAQLSLGPDGQGNSNEHIKHIMGQSMEALIHHFKIVTEGFNVPPGQAYVPIESPKGEIGCHVVSDGGSRPYRAHLRDPGFNHMQCLPAITEGGMLADIVVAIASLDSVLGGIDR